MRIHTPPAARPLAHCLQASCAEAQLLGGLWPVLAQGAVGPAAAGQLPPLRPEQRRQQAQEELDVLEQHILSCARFRSLEESAEQGETLAKVAARRLLRRAAQQAQQQVGLAGQAQ